MSYIKKLSWRIKLILAMSTMMLFSLPMALQAQEANPDQQCVTEYRKYLDEVGPQFLKEIEAHFNNPSSTSTLVPVALDKFNSYKRLVNAKRLVLENKIIPKDKTLTQTEVISIFQKCDNEMDDHINIMQQVLSVHVRRNTQSKRSFIYLQQYKSINNQLAELNTAFGAMKGNFKVLEGKVQNFVPKCVQ